MPDRKPPAAGRKARCHRWALRSMAGRSRLQMDAAAMTPAANPFKRVSRRGFKSFFRKNTQAAPREVPKKGIRIPFRISKFKSVTSFLEWMI